MERNNSEKTGRLTPGQIAEIIRISGELSKIRNVITNIGKSSIYGHVVFRGDEADSIAVGSKKGHVYFKENGEIIDSFADEVFIENAYNYFVNKRNCLVSELEKVISEKGGER